MDCCSYSGNVQAVSPVAHSRDVNLDGVKELAHGWGILYILLNRLRGGSFISEPSRDDYVCIAS